MEPVVETKGLQKAYRGVEALCGLDLVVMPQQIVGLLGPGGAGKSTVVKLLLGLVKPTAGAVRVLGMDVSRESAAVRERVGYLAQDPPFDLQLTARETLRYVASFYEALPSAAVERRIAESLDLVGLAAKADRPVRSFSPAERQRLGLAQAQINRPALLILDEPAGALDPPDREAVLLLMEQFRRQGCSILFATQVLADTRRVSDAVAVLDAGRLVACGPAASLAGEGSNKEEDV